MQHGENNREGKGKDIDITTGKGERKLKEKGKKWKEESKQKVSRWDEERRGEEAKKFLPVHTLANFIFCFTSCRLKK